MELFVILSSLCICLSLLVKPCAAAAPAASSSSQEIFVVQEQSNKELVASSEEVVFPHSTLPRKLRILRESVKDSGVQSSSIAYNEQTKPDGSSKPYKRQQNVMKGRGTWKDRVERADKSEYFTMDYTHYKRRRPIHNKSLPAGP